MTRPGRSFDRLAARSLFKRGVNRLARRHLAGSSGRRRPEIHFYYYENRISFAQIYPFLLYRDAIEAASGMALRFLPVTPYLNGRTPEPGAARLIVQTWFDIAPAPLSRFLETLLSVNPGTPVDYIDPVATNDLRCAAVVAPYIRHYYRKSLFRDRMAHLETWRGDTNLMDYAARRFGHVLEDIDRDVPVTIVPKLRLSPNFFTAPQFFDVFYEGVRPPTGPRDIDVHARMDIRGVARNLLRQPAFDAMKEVKGHHILSEDLVPWQTYMDEMHRSKLCFSPFGYGELCWRDIEAIMCGTVLIKPDMSHLDTLPDIYQDGETYLAVAWDCADLQDVIARALADPDLCRHLAETAWTRLHRYLVDGQFVEDMAVIW